MYSASQFSKNMLLYSYLNAIGFFSVLLDENDQGEQGRGEEGRGRGRGQDRGRGQGMLNVSKKLNFRTVLQVRPQGPT